MTQSEQPEQTDTHDAGPITPPPLDVPPVPVTDAPPPSAPPVPVIPAATFEQAVLADEALAKEGAGFLMNEPEVAAAYFNQPESLVRAAFVMKHRMRLSEDEMRSALDEVSNREV